MTAIPSAVQLAVLGLLEQEHGIGPRDGHCARWLDERLERAILELMTARGCSVDDIPAHLAADRAALAELANTARVGETSFYRDPPQWDALRAWLRDGAPAPVSARSGAAKASAGAPGKIAPRTTGGRRVESGRRAGSRRFPRLRGLSVGCSTGPEAYTLAMVLDDACGAGASSGWSVIGVDRSAEALEVARQGDYEADLARALPKDLAARGLTVLGDVARPRDAIRRGTRFVERDALRGLPPGQYEIVLCRNVLIYLSESGGEQLVGHLLRALAPDGMLLVARSEVSRLRTLGASAREVAPGITVFVR